MLMIICAGWLCSVITCLFWLYLHKILSSFVCLHVFMYTAIVASFSNLCQFAVINVQFWRLSGLVTSSEQAAQKDVLIDELWHLKFWICWAKLANLIESANQVEVLCCLLSKHCRRRLGLTFRAILMYPKIVLFFSVRTYELMLDLELAKPFCT